VADDGLMLTVDYDRLGVRAGERVLDLGCGFGRHAYEALRRGADVIACDLALPELVETRRIVAAMRAAGEIPDEVVGTAASADATRLPFADATFDRAIASEVLEHVPDDSAAIAELQRVLRPGGILAVTVPSWLPERLCWALSEDYHAPNAVGGHVRIYRRAQLRDQLLTAGLTPLGAHQTHALHAPYWWLRCAVGPDNDTNPAVRAYHRLLAWDIVEAPRVTRLADRLLNPILGKSLVVYARKPVATATQGPRVAA
jgi:SAM-dependent methyltransferase